MPVVGAPFSISVLENCSVSCIFFLFLIFCKNKENKTYLRLKHGCWVQHKDNQNQNETLGLTY